MDFLILVGVLALIAVIANQQKPSAPGATVVNITSSPAYHPNVPTPSASVPPPFQALGGGADVTQTPPLVVTPIPGPGDLGHDAPPSNQNALTEVTPPIVTPMNTVPPSGTNAFPTTSPVVNYIALPAITSVPPDYAPPPPMPVTLRPPSPMPMTPRPTMVDYGTGKIPLEVM